MPEKNGNYRRLTFVLCVLNSLRKIKDEMKQPAYPNMRNPLLTIFIWLLRIFVLYIVVVYLVTIISLLETDSPGLGWTSYGYLFSLITMVFPVVILYSVLFFIRKIKTEYLGKFDKFLFIALISASMILGLQIFV